MFVCAASQPNLGLFTVVLLILTTCKHVGSFTTPSTGKLNTSDDHNCTHSYSVGQSPVEYLMEGQRKQFTRSGIFGGCFVTVCCRPCCYRLQFMRRDSQIHRIINNTVHQHTQHSWQPQIQRCLASTAAVFDCQLFKSSWKDNANTSRIHTYLVGLFVMVCNKPCC